MEAVQMAAEWLRAYNENGFLWLLFVAGVAYLFVFERQHVLGRIFLGYAACFALAYVCPLSAGVIAAAIGADVYWRVLWILPASAYVAYASVRAMERVQKKVPRVLLGLGVAALICLAGKNVYLQDTPYERAVNLEKIPSSPMAICRLVEATREEGETALVAAPEDMVGYLRQYDPSILQVYGRRASIEGGSVFRRALKRDVLPERRLCRAARRIGCNYLVVKSTAVRKKKMKKSGFAQIGQVGSYDVYKDTRKSG